jgi:ribonuclease BN (tRNA processing enzyme)
VPEQALTLTVVGSAPAWSRRPGHPSSCYLVELGDDAIVLDLGQGSLGALHAYREPSTIRAIAISHLHPDHHVDLVAFRHLLRYGYPEPRTVELHPPGELRARYDAFLGEPDFLELMPGPDLAPDTRHLGALRLQISAVTHAANSHAFRVSETGDSRAGLVYSGDCGRASDLLTLLRPGDTLLCEAYWGVHTPVPEAEHLTAADAAGVARDGRAARLVLTHVGEHHDPETARSQAAEIFSGPVLLAEPGLRLTVA